MSTAREPQSIPTGDQSAATAHAEAAGDVRSCQAGTALP